MTFAWSRAASLVYSGERDGLGYRDTVQDMLGVMHIIPEEVKERLELMITGQVSTGGAMPVVKPFDHHPGKEEPPAEEEYRSDDCMWLFNTIPAFVKETGDIGFYNKVLPYSDKGKDTVLGHMRRAIQFSLDRSGAHGLPCGLSADWNDCLQLGQKGESVFVALQLRYALYVYIEVSKILTKSVETFWAIENLKKLDANIEKYAWDGDWYLRAFREDGYKFGSKENEEGSMWLSPQSWGILSGHADNKRAGQIMDKVAKRLATDYGLMICDPPYEKTDLEIIKATLFNKGMKENGSIFCHIQGWAIIAETMLGHGNRAYKYFRAFMPAAYNTKAEIREIEPYVYSQFTHSKYSPRYGASRLPWLSGSATWSYYTATQYILGIRPEYKGLTIDPCIPKDWKKFEVNRRFRNMDFHFVIRNVKGVEKGVKKIMINNTEIKGDFIPLDMMKAKNKVIVEMG
jgi:cellobiose phosphorylase